MDGYRTAEIAARFGVTIPTVWRWIREGKLQAAKWGPEYIVTEKQIQLFLERRIKGVR